MVTVSIIGGVSLRMERISHQMSMSTSLIIVRFLASNMSTFLSALDTCIMSFIIVCVVTLWGTKNAMSVLSRRLAVMLMVETVQPLLIRVIAVDVHIQSLIVNVGVIVVLCCIPNGLNEELEMLVTSMIYLYSRTLNFLLEWRREQLTILVCLVFMFRLNHRYTTQPRLQQIISISTISTISDLVQLGDESSVENKVLRYSLFLIVLHVIATNTAHEVEDSLLYSYVSFVQYSLPANEPFLNIVFSALIAMFLTNTFGLRCWPTRVAYLCSSNIFVNSMLQYVRFLAVSDTIVTLKTSALVLQFFIQIVGQVKPLNKAL